MNTHWPSVCDTTQLYFTKRSPNAAGKKAPPYFTTQHYAALRHVWESGLHIELIQSLLSELCNLSLLQWACLNPKLKIIC